MRPYQKIVFLAVLGIEAIMAFTISGCSKIPDSPTVRFEVPNGYRGFLRIVEDSNGIEIEEKDRLALVKFPVTGLVKVKSLSIFRRYFIGRAQFADGLEITFAAVEEKKVSGLTLWLLSQPVAPEIYLFLGTREEAALYRKEHPDIYRQKK